MRKDDVKFSIGVLIGFFVFGCVLAARSYGADSGGGRDLAGMAEMIKARTDYQRMLTEARIADADIRLKQATAEYQFAKAEQLRQIIEVLRHEYSRILREEAETASRVDEVEMRSVQIRPLKTGHVDGIVVLALNYFIRDLLPPQSLKDTMFKKIGALGVENFVVNDMEDGRAEPLVPFAGGNLGALIRFVDSHGYSFASWSEGHAAILDLLGVIVKTGEEKIAQYHKYMDGIRSGTLSIWQLPPT